jgi:hypothetical protein
MLEEKKGNLLLFVQGTNSVGDVACGLSFKVKLDNCSLNKLNHASNCHECFPQGSEESCLCYAIYLKIKNDLCGDPLATKRSKVGDVKCNSHNNTFVISWKVKGTGSAVRKAFAIALKGLTPDKFYQLYAQCMKELNGKVSREGFNYTVDEVAKSIKDSVVCSIVGNIKTVKKVDGKDVKMDLSPMVTMLHSKISAETSSGTKTKPSNHTPCDHSSSASISVSGWPAFVTQAYIMAKVRGLNAQIYNNNILLPIKPTQWDTLSKKLKSKLKVYIDAKYAKVEPSEMLSILAYIALSGATLGNYDIHKMLKDKVTSNQVYSAINAVL